MSWVAIGAAVTGAVVTGAFTSEQQKKAREQEEALTEQQLEQQKELTELQLEQQKQQFLGIERGQEEAQQRATQIGQKAQKQFMAATEGRPQQISRIQEIIRQQRLPEQQQAIKRGQLAQQQAGVRGPEAAQITSMLAGRLGRELGFDVEKLALEEELRRQRSREQLAGQRGLVSLGQQLQPIKRYGERA
jgi:plasmid stability protein